MVGGRITKVVINGLGSEPNRLGWSLLVSLAAGTVEEITYRGAMFALLLAMTRNWWTAVTTYVFFSLGHANQR
jgi:membrane protease YdiL (CAAX protease family)